MREWYNLSFIELIENIIQTQNICRDILEGNEAQTRWMLIDPLLLDGLGYSRNDIIVEFSIDTDNRVSRYNKLDYSILINNEPKLLVEAKSLGVNLYDKYNQLEEYFNKVLDRGNYGLKNLIGILTDGDLYLFYTNTKFNNKMDKNPFYTIRLSVSEDFEKSKLLQYSKSNLLNNYQSLLLDSDEEYELYVPYRIDMLDGVYSYFLSKNINVGIDKVYLKGRLQKIGNFRSLYKNIIKEIDFYNPDLLYYLARQEDINSNGKISNLKFSCYYINSTNIDYQVKQGKIYISLPTTRNGMIDRIVYLAQISGYGTHNILISLKEK